MHPSRTLLEERGAGLAWLHKLKIHVAIQDPVTPNQALSLTGDGNGGRQSIFKDRSACLLTLLTNAGQGQFKLTGKLL